MPKTCKKNETDSALNRIHLPEPFNGRQYQAAGEFFESTYDFLNDYFYDGDESRCLLAQVHYDEAGRPHLHYVMVMPEINNSKYKSLESKFVDGIKQTQNHFNVKLSEKQIASAGIMLSTTSLRNS